MIAAEKRRLGAGEHSCEYPNEYFEHKLVTMSLIIRERTGSQYDSETLGIQITNSEIRKEGQVVRSYGKEAF